ncbi:conserved hypothetical protein [Methylocella tundrae]|uniref:Uncharacterized protein n=1 Tax=Methylocella tundrae TaxID=227605 RepID=A0A8B6M4N8_METTU|nr:conserved hypothetical protein [Methylocella tundrae]
MSRRAVGRKLMRWPLSRRAKRSATSSRSSNMLSSGRSTAGRRVAWSSCRRIWSSSEPSTIISSRPSASARSTSAGPKAPGSKDEAASNPVGAGSRISVAGETSGTHMTGSSPTGDAGSWAKAQPPSPSETDAGSLCVDGSARDLALGADEIAAVVGVAAQKFGGKAGTFEAVQAINRLRRAPILRGHGVSSRLSSLEAGRHDPENSSAKVVLKVASRVAASRGSVGRRFTASGVQAGADSLPPSSSGPAPDGFHEPFWHGRAPGPD